MSTKIQHVGDKAPNALSSSRVVTLTNPASGAPLVVIAYINTLGTAGISGAGGSWVNVVNDTINKVFVWVNYAPTPGSTTVTIDNNGTNSHFTTFVGEQAGLKANGLRFAPAANLHTGTTAWASLTIANTTPVFAIAFAQQGTDGTTTSTAGTGWFASSGTGITTSTVLNSNEGDAIAVHVGDWGAGTLQGAGTWSVSINSESYVVGFELDAVPTVFAPPKCPTGQRNPGSGSNVMRTFFRPVYSLDVTASLATITGTLATTNADDTSSAAGTTTVVGTLAKTNANDTSSAAGTTTVLGTLARTNANDTATASGTTTVLGTLARTNANDTSAASGSPIVNGSLATTNANDTSAASGSGAVTGSAACTNNNDTCSANGEAPLAQSGAPGHRHRYVAFINGKRIVGDLGYIEAVIREFAEKQAQQAVTQAKPKKARIVVQSGRKLSAAAEAEPIPEAQTLQIQAQIRDFYDTAYAQYLLELEQDEEDALIMLL